MAFSDYPFSHPSLLLVNSSSQLFFPTSAGVLWTATYWHRHNANYINSKCLIKQYVWAQTTVETEEGVRRGQGGWTLESGPGLEINNYRGLSRRWRNTDNQVPSLCVVIVSWVLHHRNMFMCTRTTDVLTCLTQDGTTGIWLVQLGLCNFGKSICKYCKCGKLCFCVKFW